MGGLTAAGVDTVSIAWRPNCDDPFDALRQGSFRPGPTGSLIATARGRGGERVVAFPAHGVLAVEGRMAAMLSGDEADHSLAPATSFRDAEAASERVLHDVLRYRPDDQTVCEMRRYDLAAELGFDDGVDGLAFLDTHAGMCPPNRRLTLEVSPDGHAMTVYVRTPKRGVIEQRFYDKGLESGSHPPGQRIRLEAQLRPPKSKRMAPGTLARLDLRAHFMRRMEAYVSSGESIVTAGSGGAVDELVGRVMRDELSMARAERLVGSIEVLRRCGRSVYDTRQGQRRLKALRDAGVALDLELPADRVVPVGQLLRDAVEAFSA